MKKIFKIILTLIVAVVLTWPFNSQAASAPQRYYRAYRSQLLGFITNYRGDTANKQGCLRTKAQPDGTTSSCLSESKIDDIMIQLDHDGYFQVKNPIDRRNYLMATTNQVYVMKKVVMYFEQVLNPNTVVYGSNLNEKQNFGIYDNV